MDNIIGLHIGNIVTVDNPKYHPKLKDVPLVVTGIQERSDLDGGYSISLRHLDFSRENWQTYSQSLNFIKTIILTTDIANKIEGIIIRKTPITDIYSLSINIYPTEWKAISFTIDYGNQYIYIRQGQLNEHRHDDDVVTIYNGDFDGLITLNKLQNIYSEMTNGKQLKINL